MRRVNGLVSCVFAAAALVATAACDNTAAGAKKDAEIAAEEARQAGDKAADATAEAARDVKEATKEAGEAAAESAAEMKQDAEAAADTATTTAQVKSALMADTAVDASHIDVDSNGAAKTVTLKGRVPNAAQRTAAERIARDKAEGFTVINQLTIG